MKMNILILILLTIGTIACVAGAYYFGYKSASTGNQPLIVLSGNKLESWSYIATIVATVVAIATVIYIAVAYQSQQEQSERERFETTFYNMLTNVNNVVTSMEVKTGEYKRFGPGLEQDGYDLHGLKCFDLMQKFARLSLHSIDSYDSTNGYPVYENPFQLFLQYNNSLALTLEFVEDSNLSEDEKKLFFSIVVEPMTFYQKCAFIYHIALCDDSTPINKKLKKLERERRLLSCPYPTDLRWAGQMNRAILYERGIVDFGTDTCRVIATYQKNNKLINIEASIREAIKSKRKINFRMNSMDIHKFIVGEPHALLLNKSNELVIFTYIVKHHTLDSANYFVISKLSGIIDVAILDSFTPQTNWENELSKYEDINYTAIVDRVE